MFDFDKVCTRRGTGCVKWDEDREGVIPMWVADMDFRTAPCIIEALRKRVEQGIYGYAHVLDRYYDSVCGWFSQRHGWQISREQIIYTTGVIPAMSSVIKALTSPGDNVLIQTPVYNCFFSSIKNNECVMLENRLIYKTCSESNLFTFGIDFDDFEEKVSRAKVFFLCNPQNPAGRVWTREELRRMGEICLKHGVPVISDEIHCEIVMPGYGYTPMASISPEFRDNTITMCSPSKAFNLAGLQIANIITSRADWREKINRALNLNEVCDVNAFGVEALTSAYTEPEARVWLDELNTYISGNYEYLKDFFAKELPWLPVSVLEGTYLVWCDCRSLGLSSDEIEKTLVERFNVHINAGRMYGEAGEGFIRINLATPRSLAEEGLSCIAAGLKALRP